MVANLHPVMQNNYTDDNRRFSVGSMFCAKCFGTILEDLNNLSKDLNIAMQNGRIGILLLNVVHFNQTLSNFLYAVFVMIFSIKECLLTSYKRSPQKDQGLRLYNVCFNFLTLCVYAI